MKVVVEPIRSESDLKRAREEIERLQNAPIGTPDGDKLDVLIDLAEAYERRKGPGSPSQPAAALKPATKKGAKRQDPISAIQAAMKERGMKPIDLGPVLGSTPRAYEVLSGKRGLSIAMIRSVHKQLGIPLEVLVGLDGPAKAP